MIQLTSGERFQNLTPKIIRSIRPAEKGKRELLEQRILKINEDCQNVNPDCNEVY